MSKHANRYANTNIIEDDAPMYQVQFYNWARYVGDECVSIYHKYDKPCSYEQAYHNLKSAMRELDELAFANDGKCEDLFYDSGDFAGTCTTYAYGWAYDKSQHAEYHFCEDFEEYDEQDEPVYNSYMGYAIVWIEEV